MNAVCMHVCICSLSFEWMCTEKKLGVERSIFISSIHFSSDGMNGLLSMNNNSLSNLCTLSYPFLLDKRILWTCLVPLVTRRVFGLYGLIFSPYILFLSAFRDRGVPKPTSECRRVPQPRWVDARPSAKGGSEVAGDGRERGENPAAFVFVPRPGRVRLQ
jgi:hypothetical protein